MESFAEDGENLRLKETAVHTVVSEVGIFIDSTQDSLS